MKTHCCDLKASSSGVVPGWNTACVTPLGKGRGKVVHIQHANGESY